MSVIDVLRAAGNAPHVSRARHRWNRLDDEQKAAVERNFVRHVKACRSVGIDPEIAWIAESIDDVLLGRE